jgi:pimeloyl-ACP methyl ester carboxylesterase
MRLILLPGMGADARLFDGLREHLPQVEVLEWIEHAPNESFADYAARMARRIDDNAPLVIGGVSMGGMAAAEMVQHLRPRGLVLISSAMNSECLARFQPIERLLRVLPPSVLPRLARSRPMVRALCGPLSLDHRALFQDMLRSTPATFVRWGVRAMMNWPGADIDAIPVLQVHGERDRAIPLPPPEQTAVILRGGHLCVLTHPRETAKAIAAWMARLG